MLSSPKQSAAAKKPARALPDDFFNWLVLGSVFLVLIVSLWMGWRALHTTASVIDTSFAEQAPTATPLPTLQLNTTHQRQGEQIQVNPNNIGKSDPFQ